MDSDDTRLVEVYRASNLPEAHVIRAALEDAGIGVRVDGELIQGVVGEAPMGWPTAPRLLVREDDESHAREIIERARQRREELPDDDDEETRCLACGRILPETARSCPACGWSYEAPRESPVESEATTAPAAVAPRSRWRAGRWILALAILLAAVFGGLYWVRKTGDAAFARGQTALDRKDYETAVAEFTTAVHWQPRSAEAILNRCFAKYQLGNFRSALADADEAVRLAPYWMDAYRLRGFCHLEMGHPSNALKDFDKAWELAPKSPWPRYSFGYLYAREKDYAKAVEQFSAALKADPAFHPALAQLAWIWATAADGSFRDGRKALPAAKKACELTEWKVSDYWETLAAAHAELGEFEAAIALQTKAMASPDFAEGPHQQKSRLEATARLALYQEGKAFREK